MNLTFFVIFITMIRIADAILQTIERNPFLQFGFHHGLFNLTQLARYLEPLVAARAKKPVTVSAITMNLSRLQQPLRKIPSVRERFFIDNLSIHSGLCTLTYPKSPVIHGRVHALHQRVQKQNGYSSISEGMREITVIIEGDFRPLVRRLVRVKPKYEHTNLASVGVEFAERYANVPGLLYALLQRVTLQNVNIIEVLSTYTEIVFYIDEKDTQVVFDTLFQSFLMKAK